jgi:hypothetical protein
MSEAGSYNLQVLDNELRDQFSLKLAQAVMEKCHSSCMLSLNENRLLAHEEACFRNCFVKSAQFNKHFENEMRYTIRQFQNQAKD